MSQSPLLEVELYAFASSSAQFYLTPHEFDVELDGNLYKSLALERNELALGAEAAKSALDLKLPPNCDLVRHLLANSLTGDTTSITLRIGRRDSWGDYWWISGTRWMGRVLGVEVADDVARVRCESAQVSLKRIGLRRLYSRKCSHVLYSAACGASPISGSAIVTQVYGRNVEFEGGIPGSVSGGLAGGWLQTPEGARHMIVSEGWSSVELLYPAAIEPGVLVSLTVGCDHSTATCQSRFNNLDNYGGFPAIPIKNPFSTGVF
ncbi:tail protein [Geobacter sulfurreducens]|nr:tail protein [Geobacter sulfurreducens]